MNLESRKTKPADKGQAENACDFWGGGGGGGGRVHNEQAQN